jgi:hypothetical protein
MRSDSDSTSTRRLTALATALALGAVLGACTDDQAGPLAPDSFAPTTAIGAATAPAAQLSADAVARLLPALGKDAATPLGRALRELDAKLADAKATPAARERSLRVVENTLAQFAAAGRADAADLDAMRLAVADVRTLLQP